MDNNSRRGTKRKRYEPPKEDLQVKIAGKLHHVLKEVRRAAKKAKTFETQKLVKKLKGIRKNDPKSREISELEAQLEALKPISHELIANTVLKRRLNKDPILSGNEHVRTAVSNELVTTLIPTASDSFTRKSESRLLSSKILATEVAVIVEDLRALLQLKNEGNDLGMKDEVTIPVRREKLKQVSQGGVSQIVDLQLTRSEDQVERAGGASLLDDLSSEPDAQEVDKAGWESGTLGDNGRNIGDSRELGSLADSDSDDDTEELAESSTTKLPKTSRHSKLPSSMASSSAQQSTFLPSLSVGFVRGASDDSDFGESGTAVGDIDFKKNRRGQRARRAIWEKKYGRNANHKKKELEHRGTSNRKEHRRSGTSSEQHRDAPDRRQALNRAVPHALHEANQDAKAVAQSNALQERKEERSLHPSWEAKRKLKEKESASIVPSRGKKIKFS